MKARSLLAIAATLACTAIHADYDAKLEAEEAAKRGAVVLERDENSANYRVRLPAGE